MKILKRTLILCALFCSLSFVVYGCSSSDNNTDSAPIPTETAVETEKKAINAPTAEETEEKKKNKDIFNDDNIKTFELSSDDLHEGVWDTIITNTANGSNVSPHLKWEPVPDAECYAVYMIDTTAGNWLHWESYGLTETELPQGWANEDEYVGPCPPGDTHSYEIYVVALKKNVELTNLNYDGSNIFFSKLASELDVYDNTEGNVISYGHIKGTYTYGD
ncbi:MAG: phosphatidylethanolamine-binding protein [Ruminococcus sp.]|nr:phosphatidylethanolamine-binding protein [Ruminococcus sp.]